jgi:hypothetical protein
VSGTEKPSRTLVPSPMPSGPTTASPSGSVSATASMSLAPMPTATPYDGRIAVNDAQRRRHGGAVGGIHAIAIAPGASDAHGQRRGDSLAFDNCAAAHHAHGAIVRDEPARIGVVEHVTLGVCRHLVRTMRQVLVLWGRLAARVHGGDAHLRHCRPRSRAATLMKLHLAQRQHHAALVARADADYNAVGKRVAIGDAERCGVRNARAERDVHGEREAGRPLPSPPCSARRHVQSGWMHAHPRADYVGMLRVSSGGAPRRA